MAVTRRGKYDYADTQADLPEVLLDYSRANGYLTQHYAHAVCVCGGRLFQLCTDDECGVAVRRCAACETEHWIGDSAEFAGEATPEECECVCGARNFEITAGVALYEESDDVKWLYIGCRCPACHLAGCYGDWKNEFENYRQLLAQV